MVWFCMVFDGPDFQCYRRKVQVICLPPHNYVASSLQSLAQGALYLHGLSGKSKFTASQQDKKFGILDIQITKNGNKLEATYYTNEGKVKDHFSIVNLQQEVLVQV